MRKLQYLGHLIRHNTSQLQLIQGKIEGRRSCGRPRTTWITDLTNNTGAKYYQLKRAAEDRNMAWSGSQPRTRNDTSVMRGKYKGSMPRCQLLVCRVCMKDESKYPPPPLPLPNRLPPHHPDPPHQDHPLQQTIVRQSSQPDTFTIRVGISRISSTFTTLMSMSTPLMQYERLTKAFCNCSKDD